MPPASLVHTVEPISRLRDRRTILVALAVVVIVCAIYNANGREIGSYDSQPTKFAAIELARRGTLTLDAVVRERPALADRSGFAIDRDGHYRSAYSPLPALEGGAAAATLSALHVIDLDAPLAPALVAKLTASMLAALAVGLAFLAARRRLSERGALLLALGFGLGTNLWAVSSQTLWQSETVIAALCACVLCLAVPRDRLTARRASIAALFLGLAGAARPQLAAAVAVLALSIVVRRAAGWRGLLVLLPLAGVGAVAACANLAWFGHVLGAFPQLEALHPDVHAVTGTFGNPLAGGAGLLISPSRGLLVFSPVVLVAACGTARVAAQGWRGDLRWWALATCLQFAVYASYAIWWGGHTYGPRYCLDLLPMMLPLAVAGMPVVAKARWRAALGVAALAWSIAVAATGAFVYPHEAWNSSPDEVDRHHARLWDVRDPQVLRCWKSAPSPQNFGLFSTDAVRRPAPAR